MVFGEPRSREAADLLRGSNLHAPALLAYELASVARKKIARDRDPKDVVLEGLRIGLNLITRWVDVDYHQVVELALETGLSTYDASYIYVARSIGVELVTFDRRLEAAARLP